VILLSLWLACRAPEQVPLADAPPVWIEQRRVDEGQAIRLHVPDDRALPEIEGLTATQAAVGDDGSVTWELRGKSGSYVMDLPNPKGDPTRLFFDIGVDGPTGGKMEDLVAVAPAPPSPWPRVAAVAAVLVAVVAGALLAWRRFRPLPPPPPPEPADRVARREWAALRARTDLGPDALAGGLAGVYRRYLEAVHGWPATSRTSREILNALAGDMTAVQLERARRLLFAMDIVRFSGRHTHEGFFGELDGDFEALLSAPARVAHA
jgi:hypothetical protein